MSERTLENVRWKLAEVNSVIEAGVDEYPIEVVQSALRDRWWLEREASLLAELASARAQLEQLRDALHDLAADQSVEAFIGYLCGAETHREIEAKFDRARQVLAAVPAARTPEGESPWSGRQGEQWQPASALFPAREAVSADERAELGDCLPPPWTVECQACGAEWPADPEVRTYSGCPACAGGSEDVGT